MKKKYCIPRHYDGKGGIGRDSGTGESGDSQGKIEKRMENSCSVLVMTVILWNR